MDNLDFSNQNLPFAPNRDPDLIKRGEIEASIINAGHNFFSDTNLTKENQEIISRDLEAIQNFFIAVREIHPAVFNEGTLKHILLTGVYADLLYDNLSNDLALAPEYPKNIVLVAALLHDIGRTVSHRRGVNEIYGASILKITGIRSDITDLIPPDSLFTDLRKKAQNTTGELWPRAIVTIADVLAKSTQNEGQFRMRRWNEVIESANKAQNRPDKETMWPEEYERQKKVLANWQLIATIYTHIGKWYGSNSQRSIEEIVSAVEMDMNEHKEYLKFYWE